MGFFLFLREVPRSTGVEVPFLMVFCKICLLHLCILEASDSFSCPNQLDTFALSDERYTVGRGHSKVHFYVALNDQPFDRL